MDKTELLRLIDNDLSIRQISDSTGKSATSVRFWLKKYGLKTKRNQYNKSPNTQYKCACGQTDPSKFYGHKKSKCGTCHSQYTLDTGRAKRKQIVDYMGGKCQNCGWNAFLAGLQVHHLDTNEKDPSFASHRGWKWERILKEIEGCILLCAICHIGVHTGDVLLNHIDSKSRA